MAVKNAFVFSKPLIDKNGGVVISYIGSGASVLADLKKIRLLVTRKRDTNTGALLHVR